MGEEERVESYLIEITRIEGNNFDIVTYKDEYNNSYLQREYHSGKKIEKPTELGRLPGAPNRFDT